jgi:hypothetical protein
MGRDGKLHITQHLLFGQSLFSSGWDSEQADEQFWATEYLHQFHERGRHKVKVTV